MTAIYCLSLHDALPIFITVEGLWKWRLFEYLEKQETPAFNEILDKVIDYVSQEKDDRLFRLRKNKLLFDETEEITFQAEDRKSTRLNSSHVAISYAVFC